MKKLLFFIAILAFVGTTASAKTTLSKVKSSIVVIDNNMDSHIDIIKNIDNDKDKDKDKKKKSKKSSSCCEKKDVKNCAKTCDGKTSDPSCKGQVKSAKASCCPGGEKKAAEPVKPE